MACPAPAPARPLIDLDHIGACDAALLVAQHDDALLALGAQEVAHLLAVKRRMPARSRTPWSSAM